MFKRLFHLYSFTFDCNPRENVFLYIWTIQKGMQNSAFCVVRRESRLNFKDKSEQCLTFILDNAYSDVLLGIRKDGSACRLRYLESAASCRKYHDMEFRKMA